MADVDVIEFTIDGREYTLDLNMETMTGEELLEIEDRTGMTFMEWCQKLSDTRKTSIRDILLMTYLAERRNNTLVVWDVFVRHLHPFTFTWGHPAKAKSSTASGRGTGTGRR